jgi:hypothetical protein
MSEKATVETVQQQLLDAISKSLQNNQHDQAAMLIGSFNDPQPLSAVRSPVEIGLDSGVACKETA